jgi:hypothetical protein
MRLRHSLAAALGALALTGAAATANNGLCANMTGSQEVPPTSTTATGAGHRLAGAIRVRADTRQRQPQRVLELRCRR